MPTKRSLSIFSGKFNFELLLFYFREEPTPREEIRMTRFNNDRVTFHLFYKFRVIYVTVKTLLKQKIT